MKEIIKIVISDNGMEIKGRNNCRIYDNSYGFCYNDGILTLVRKYPFYPRVIMLHTDCNIVVKYIQTNMKDLKKLKEQYDKLGEEIAKLEGENSAYTADWEIESKLHYRNEIGQEFIEGEYTYWISKVYMTYMNKLELYSGHFRLPYPCLPSDKYEIFKTKKDAIKYILNHVYCKVETKKDLHDIYGVNLDFVSVGKYDLDYVYVVLEDDVFGNDEIGRYMNECDLKSKTKITKEKFIELLKTYTELIS